MMTRLMQTASALTLAAALAGMPVLAAAQQATTETESQTEQAVEGAAQEAGQAVEGAAQEVGQAVEGAAQETEQAVEGATTEAGQEVKEVEVEIEQTTTTTEGQPIDQPGGAVLVEGQQPVEEVEGVLVLQDEDSMLTSDLMDATVYNAQGEKVGEIDDAIVSLGGTVDGVVIGVGGFLGIGEKHVAVEMQQLSIQMDENNEPQLIIDTTKEALEAAPEFVTAETQRREEEQQQMQQAAPAPGTEPASGMLTSDPAQPATEGQAPAQPAQN